MLRTISAVVMTGLLAAAPVAAQQSHHPGQAGGWMPGYMGMPGAGMGMMMGGGMGMMGGGMGAMMGPGGVYGGAAMILRLSEPLGLTDAQVSKLEKIDQDATRAAQTHAQAAAKARTAAAEALQGDAPDLDAYQARLREAAEHTVQLQMVSARAAANARGVLTTDQREQLRQGVGMISALCTGMMGGNGGPGGIGGGMHGMHGSGTPGAMHGSAPASAGNGMSQRAGAV